MALKSLIQNLFGDDAWLEIKHATDLKTWKKYSHKILSAIAFSAEATVKIADKDWQNELNSIVEFGKIRITNSKTAENLFANLSASLTNISFHQLGLMPSRIGLKRVTLRHKSNWELDNFRSIQYVQNGEQSEAKKQYDLMTTIENIIG